MQHTGFPQPQRKVNVCGVCGKGITLRKYTRCHTCANVNRWKGSRYNTWLPFQITQKEKYIVRRTDRIWFKHWLSEEYMSGKEIDHDWRMGALCRVLSHEEHLKIERGRKGN